MIKKYFFILFSISFLFNQEKIFWDFQLKIKKSNETDFNKKDTNVDAMISNIHIEPKLLDYSKNTNLKIDFQKLTTKEKINKANKLFIDEKYDLAIQYYLKINFDQLNPEIKKSTIYSCAYSLFASAQFKAANQFIEKYKLGSQPKDLMLEGLILSETNKEVAIKKLNHLIKNFPNDDLSNAAKLKLKLLHLKN